MAWGSQGQVFLGEDLMHSRDYSEDTSRIIDDEVERILREQETRAIELLSTYRGGLDSVAQALLTDETIDGARVSALVDQANGGPVHESGPKAVVPTLNGAARTEQAPTPSVTPAGFDEPLPDQTWAPPAWPDDDLLT
jgi:cell division protease FtsH